MANKADKIWTDALRRALHRESNGKGSPKWLEVIADRVVEAAADGDAQAYKEIGDRIEGKPVARHEVAGDDEAPLVTEVRYTVVDVAKGD